MVEFALALIVLNHVDKKGDFLIRRLILEGFDEGVIDEGLFLK